ncbi:MAG: HupE/UreJ family protein [Thermoanaerobaculia bacterium]|nr:HupE/UreJ family protein [Thermoanaerobaculia bacterium]
MKPGYLELTQTDAERYEVLFKLPGRADLSLGIAPLLPDACAAVAPVATRRAGDARIQTWAIRCRGGLAGREVGVSGISTTPTDVLVRLERADGSVQMELLTPSAPTFVVRAAPGRLAVAGTYLRLGVEHILLGIDHLLFVLALLILVEGRRRLVGTITAFTVAHSLTLAAAVLGFVAVPQAPVEAVIALSIVFVAGEILHAREGRAGVTQRSPWIVAFVFGLLHGFGFAGALLEMGLPERAIPLALLFFNVGVEVGQLLFIAAAGAAVVAARRLRLEPPTWAWRIPAYGIGSLAAFWLIERVAGFFG